MKNFLEYNKENKNSNPKPCYFLKQSLSKKNKKSGSMSPKLYTKRKKQKGKE